MTGALKCVMESGKVLTFHANLNFSMTDTVRKKFNVGTGLSDKQRNNPPKIGSIIVYRFQELTRDGVPRFVSLALRPFLWDSFPCLRFLWGVCDVTLFTVIFAIDFQVLSVRRPIKQNQKMRKCPNIAKQVQEGQTTCEGRWMLCTTF